MRHSCRTVPQGRPWRGSGRSPRTWCWNVVVAVLCLVGRHIHTSHRMAMVSALSIPTHSTNTHTTTTIVLGLNAALQTRFLLDRDATLIPGNVHRATHVSVGLGGKGQDVTVTLRCLQGHRPTTEEAPASEDHDRTPAAHQKHTVLPAQFIGSGAAGDQVLELVRGLWTSEDDDDDDDDDDPHKTCLALTVRPVTGMRTCTSIVSATATTELVEPNGMVSEADQTALLERLDEWNRGSGGSDNHCRALCVMGSLPPGCPDDFYATFYKRLVEHSPEAPAAPLEQHQQQHQQTVEERLVLIDSVAGLDPLLTAIQTTPTSTAQTIVLLKLNVAELCRLVHVAPTSHQDAAGSDVSTVRAAVAAFWNNDHTASVTALCLTDGAHQAYAAVRSNNNNHNNHTMDDYSLHCFSVPTLDPGDSQPQTTTTTVLYPIGAGDSVAAGTLAAWTSLDDHPDGGGPPLLPPSLTRVVRERRDAEAAEDDRLVVRVRTAFAFGLACGSASCLQEENSVVEVSDVLRLYAAAPTTRTMQES